MRRWRLQRPWSIGELASLVRDVVHAGRPLQSEALPLMPPMKEDEWTRGQDANMAWARNRNVFTASSLEKLLSAGQRVIELVTCEPR